jgi:cell division protease FtsH
MKSKGEEVDYKTFVAMIEEGSVESVLVEDSRIEFTALNDEGEEAVFITGRMEDPALTERLLATNAKFTQEIIPEESPLLNFFLIWILPLALLYVFWGLHDAQAAGKSRRARRQRNEIRQKQCHGLCCI